jgi:luciferase-like monooxygenase
MRLEVLPAEADLAFEPPLRLGPRPQSCLTLPHVQLDQWPPPSIAEELLGQCLTLPNVRPQQSRMAAPDCHALSLPDEFSVGPPTAFIVDHEFCHLHPLPDSSIHLTLPKEVRERAIRRGWAEPHLISRAGILPETLVMVYAPRNSDELAVVVQMVWQSYQFARGVRMER